jgi:hypothetical protein
MKIFFRLVASVVLLFGALCSPVSAAILFSAPGQIQAVPHQQFAVDVLLDTQQDDLNALEGKVFFPTDLLELKEVRDGSSIINFWVERPQKGTSPVTFSGVIPGGYRFPKGMIFSLVFEAKEIGQGNIRIEQARALKNDGQGTPALLTLTFSSVTVAETVPAPAAPVPGLTDTDPPEVFVPQMSQDPSIFDGKWFLSFATQDKSSGIDHYEIQETSFWGKEKWVVGESPYELKHQDPTRTVYVKAVDRAGNERIGTASPAHTRDATYDRIVILGIIFVIACGIYVFWKRHRSQRRKK